MLDGSWRGIWKSTLRPIQTRDHTNRWMVSASCVYSVTQARTHYIHIWDTSHKQTWARAPQPKKQHMHKTGSGATTERCCFNGSDLLLLRPVWKSWAAASAAASSHWMNPVPWQQVTWSSGLWATACLPACPDVRAAFNHSSFWLQLQGPPLFNANQCHAAKDATHWACH